MTEPPVERQPNILPGAECPASANTEDAPGVERPASNAGCPASASEDANGESTRLREESQVLAVVFFRGRLEGPSDGAECPSSARWDALVCAAEVVWPADVVCPQDVV